MQQNNLNITSLHLFLYLIMIKCLYLHIYNLIFIQKKHAPVNKSQILLMYFIQNVYDYVIKFSI